MFTNEGGGVMKRTMLALPVALVAAGILAVAAAPAFAGDEFCPMGGMLIKAELDKDKALAWGKDRRKVAIVNEDKDDGDQDNPWSVLTLSVTDSDIAILVRNGGVFFGVAGKGREEIDAKAAEKAFGRDLRDLADAVKKDLESLRDADAVKIEGSDVGELAKAVALGVFEKKGRRDWELKTEDCTGTDVDTSGL
jgi:hypothetical protein